METFKEKCRCFLKNHPHFSRWLDKAGRIMDLLMVVYIGGAVLAIASLSIITYLCAPAEIKEFLSIVVGATLSVFIVPFVLNYYSEKRTRQFERYQANEQVYKELVEIILKLISPKMYPDGVGDDLKQFLENHEKDIFLVFPSRLVSDLYLLYRACLYRHLENIRYYGTICLTQIRSEGGLGKGETVIGHLELIREKVSNPQDIDNNNFSVSKEYGLYKNKSQKNSMFKSYTAWYQYVKQTYCNCDGEELENFKRQLIDISRKKEFWCSFWGDVAPWLTTAISILGALVPIVYSVMDKITEVEYEMLVETKGSSAILEVLESIMKNFDTILSFYGVIIVICIIYMSITVYLKRKYTDQCNFLCDFLEIIGCAIEDSKNKDIKNEGACID